jgi:DNA-directed RNA polymerase specialized sigma24 family protein
VSPAPSPGSDDPDTGVVVRLSKGESGALQELMDAHWAPLVRYAAGILSGPADPQDLVQGVFLRLWDRRRRLKAQGSLKALLYTMVRNASLDELRRNARRAKAEGTARGGGGRRRRPPPAGAGRGAPPPPEWCPPPWLCEPSFSVRPGRRSGPWCRGGP